MNNYIKYLQAGGTAPVNDTQSQITALVEAAMSGDQKAVKQIEQIMQAAQQGNQEAQQIAGLIQQVAQQLQGDEVPQAETGRKVEEKPIQMTRADQDFANQIKRANSTYQTYAVPEEGRSFENGTIDLPQNGVTYFRDIVHYNDGVPSDTIYSYARPYMDSETNSTMYQKGHFVPSESQRRILDAKYDNTPTSNLYKCGGKVKKAQKGLPIPDKKVAKNAKGGCPCQLKKVGGKLVEVDSCTGQIVK